LSLDGHDAEIFLAGKQHSGRTPIEIAHLLVADRPEQLDVGACGGDARGERGALGAIAHDPKGRAREAARLDRHVYAFVEDEG
jgi:hypothetical protein